MGTSTHIFGMDDPPQLKYHRSDTLGARVRYSGENSLGMDKALGFIRNIVSMMYVHRNSKRILAFDMTA